MGSARLAWLTSPDIRDDVNPGGAHQLKDQPADGSKHRRGVRLTQNHLAACGPAPITSTFAGDFCKRRQSFNQQLFHLQSGMLSVKNRYATAACMATPTAIASSLRIIRLEWHEAT